MKKIKTVADPVGGSETMGGLCHLNSPQPSPGLVRISYKKMGDQRRVPPIPQGPNSFISMQFSAKKYKIIG